MLSPEAAARVYGPTAGDHIRLGDSSLRIRVEHDDQPAGDEVLGGFAKTARDGLMARAGSDAVDIAITQVVLLDPVLGVRRTAIGIRDGRIVAIGRAGNPDLMDDVDVVLGTSTAIISGEGLIATPGAIDPHVHLLSPRLVDQALAAGFTTLVIQDYGPVWNLGTNPVWALQHLHAALDASAINTVMLARGSSSRPEPLERMIESGAAGLKIHEDVGAHPTALATAFDVCDRHDVQLCVHTDGLNESMMVDETLAIAAGRTWHAFHVEGAGGGHAPDLLRIVGRPGVLGSSTNPTLPFGVNAVAEHGPMIRHVHVLRDDLPGDAALADDRVRARTMAAEGPLHDLGLIHMMSSDSQGMGRIGETLRRCMQTASVMRDARGSEGPDDNERVLRFLAKCTINPAITHGISEHVGSIQTGRLADIVLWDPAWFAVKPTLVLKGGFPAWGEVGDPNATIAIAQPTQVGRQIGALGSAPARLSIAFVSAASIASGTAGRLPTGKERIAVRGTRDLGADSMVRNTGTGDVTVDPSTRAVHVDGEPIEVPPVTTVPLSGNYLLG
jgi:urease subunit alpha